MGKWVEWEKGVKISTAFINLPFPREQGTRSVTVRKSDLEHLQAYEWPNENSLVTIIGRQVPTVTSGYNPTYNVGK